MPVKRQNAPAENWAGYKRGEGKAGAKGALEVALDGVVSIGHRHTEWESIHRRRRSTRYTRFVWIGKSWMALAS